jgi:ApaG protein
MATLITDGVKISVISNYQPNYSFPEHFHYVFNYEITIENLSNYTIQLLRRRWLIYDSNGEIREVEGEGVVGQQPILEPGMVHKYISGCNLKTDMGKMCGQYLMERYFDGTRFWVKVPDFNLIPSYKNN